MVIKVLERARHTTLKYGTDKTLYCDVAITDTSHFIAFAFFLNAAPYGKHLFHFVRRRNAYGFNKQLTTPSLRDIN
jgi:hypothetical protein